MIAYIKGRIIEKSTNSVIVDVTGVGYEIFTTTHDAENATIDSEQKFYTYHSIKENAEELYGFSTIAGKKSAERITVDLRDKVGLPSYIEANSPTSQATSRTDDEALDALMALGFSLADGVLFLSDVPTDLPTSERVRLALKKRS